jgi:hypothetical protein
VHVSRSLIKLADLLTTHTSTFKELAYWASLLVWGRNMNKADVKFGLTA